MPLFADVKLHNALIDALAMLVRQNYNSVDVVVGLDSRGFLFGPSLALRLNAAFVPVRKQGKLPGPCETEGFKKEYGEDFFQLQSDAIKPGQKVLVVDDIIATGKLSVIFEGMEQQANSTLQVEVLPQLATSSPKSAVRFSDSSSSWSSTSSRAATSSTVLHTPSSPAKMPLSTPHKRDTIPNASKHEIKWAREERPRGLHWIYESWGMHSWI